MAIIRKEDVQEIIAEVRALLESRNDPSEADLQRLAKKYTAAIQQVNSLLTTCLELVEKGLKLDAISRADEGSLLEIVSILDFPEQPVWVEYLDQFGIPAPPAIDHYASRQINACYAPARRLEPLYRLNRRHALANSPLSVRLGVMRRIHKMEEATAKEVAARQVELFETERLKTIRTELPGAIQQHDHGRLTLLCAELSSKDWLKAPDPALIKNAARALRQENARRAKVRMGELASLLQNMWSANDVAGGRKIREEWNNCQTHALLSMDDPLILETQAAFRWLQESDDEDAKKAKYEQLLAQLSDGLDKRQSKEVLLPIQHAVDGFEQGIPEPLRRRLSSWYDELNIESHRKYVRRLIVVCLMVIGAAALAMFVLRERAVNETIAGHMSALTALLDRNDVDAAEAYVETLQREQPEMLRVPQIQAMLVVVERARQDEDARQELFRAGCQAIESGLASASRLTETTALRSQLEALTAQSATESEELERLGAEIEKKHQQVQKLVDETFTANFQKAVEEYHSVETSGLTDRKVLEDFRQRFRDLSTAEGVSPELIAGSSGPKDLLARLDAKVTELNDQAIHSQLLLRITDSVGSLANYRTAIDAYVKQFPKHPRSLRFDNLLKTEADLWPRMETLNTFVGEHSKDCTKLTPVEARKYVAEADAFFMANPEFPRRDDLKAICDYLRFIGQRVDESGAPIESGMIDQLEMANLNDLFLVLTVDGKRRYTNKEPEILDAPPRVRLFPLTDSTAVVRQRQEKSVNLALAEVDIRNSSGKPDWAAPESVLVREITQDLSRIHELDWERTMADMLIRVYNGQRQHPIFHLFLLRTVLKTAAMGSPVTSQRYQKTLEQLNSEQLRDVDPFDPDHEETVRIAARATELLKSVQDPASLPDDIAAHREKISRITIGGEYQWVGWLNHEAAGWICLCDRPPTDDLNGQLFIFAKPGEEAPRLYPIGMMQKGKPLITDTSAFLVEGRPVYLYRE